MAVNTLIAANQIHGNSGSGVYIYNGASNTSIRDNTITGNGGDVADFAGSTICNNSTDSTWNGLCTGTMANPMTTAGDFVYGLSTGAPQRLGQPGNGLWGVTFASGVPAWTTLGTAAQISSTCSGDLSGTLPGCTVASIGGKAISLAGSFTTTGAFASVIAVPSAGTWTLPAPGTLVAGSIATGANPGPVPYVAAANTLGEDASNHCWDATNHRLGIGTCAPAYPLDISFTITTAPYLHISNTSADSGLYLASNGSSGSVISSGSVNNAGTWTAKATSAEAISPGTGAIYFLRRWRTYCWQHLCTNQPFRDRIGRHLLYTLDWELHMLVPTDLTVHADLRP